MTTTTYAVTGAYSFADTFDVADPSQGIFARAGRLTGAWRFTDKDGKGGNFHVNGATAVRIVPNEPVALQGLMEMNMSEFEGSAPGADVLYLAYEAKDAKFGLSSTTFVVEGRFVGGKGKFAGASGTLRVVSVNGFIGEGTATVALKR